MQRSRSWSGVARVVGAGLLAAALFVGAPIVGSIVGCGGAPTTIAARGAAADDGARRPSDGEVDLDLALPDARSRVGAPVLQELRPHAGIDSPRPLLAPGPQNGTASLPIANAIAAGAARRTDSALDARVRAIVDKALGAARTGSKGRVDGGNTTIAVELRAVGAAVPRVSLRADAALIPASNLKLFTAAAALVLHGPDAQFETTFEAHGALADGRLVGDLVVRAGGDPLYTYELGNGPARDSRGDVEAWLDRLAAELREAGIAHVDGLLVLDDSHFEPERVPAGWPSASDHWQAYCARSGGFTVNAGCISALVTPTRAGRAARVELHPRDVGLDMRVSVQTGARRSGNDVRVGATTTTGTVRGALAEGEQPFRAEFAHPSPAELFGSAVVGGLARRGIVVARGFERGARPAEGPVVARLHTPYAATLVPILRDSNNPVADQLFFATAHARHGRGDRASGERALHEALHLLGGDPEGLVALDGSGLSKVDRCSARQLTALLSGLAARGDAAFAAYFGALPVAGENGKLGGRMRGTKAAGRVRAKTGFVNGASSLSGYVEAQDGGLLAFSILVNYPPVSGLNNSAWKPMQDELCALFAEVSSR
jgi:D-alanyl-D-alanine carboxypeptidase/D-alanyl-D-alanine-endopeptidase (penicillin-binding protein 4)